MRDKRQEQEAQAKPIDCIEGCLALHFEESEPLTASALITTVGTVGPSIASGSIVDAFISGYTPEFVWRAYGG